MNILLIWHISVRKKHKVEKPTEVVKVEYGYMLS